MSFIYDDKQPKYNDVELLIFIMFNFYYECSLLGLVELKVRFELTTSLRLKLKYLQYFNTVHHSSLYMETVNNNL